MIRFGVRVSIAIAAVLAGLRARRSSFGDGLVGATLGLVLVTMVRAQPHPFEGG